jgi:pimeloyl-ACP methyl ester carboxylesterase
MTSSESPRIADQGFFFVGLTRAARPYGTAVAGQMYVQYQVPAELRHPYPIVMVHGGGGQGLDYLGTPDGRPGWATLFLREGYAVYVVDRPGMGRSPYHPDLLGPSTPPPTIDGMVAGFAAPASSSAMSYPQARLHHQWPGTGLDGDPALDQFMAGQEPVLLDMALVQEGMRRGGSELLDRIGPAVLMTHSMGAPFGWLVADRRPDLVKGILAVEPLGPAFAEIPGIGSIPWGLTSIPVTFDPPVADPSEFGMELRRAPKPDLVDCFVQAEPARQLPNLKGVPILVVTAEASWHVQTDWGVVAFLVQAGATAEQLRLEDHGIHGNGHLMMLEKNNAEIVPPLTSWIEHHVESTPARAT